MRCGGGGADDSPHRDSDQTLEGEPLQRGRMTRGRDKRGSLGVGPGGSCSAHRRQQPIGPFLPTRPPLHLLEPVRSHGKPCEQLQILQKPSRPEPGLLSHTQVTAGPAARARARPFRTAGGQRWQLLEVGVQRPESTASPSLSLRGQNLGDCCCPGEPRPGAQAAAAPTLRESWLRSQRTPSLLGGCRDALEVWWALPSYVPMEDEWDGQTLELSLGLLPALHTWPQRCSQGLATTRRQ